MFLRRYPELIHDVAIAGYIINPFILGLTRMEDLCASLRVVTHLALFVRNSFLFLVLKINKCGR